MKFLQDTLTGKDNLTFDAARLIGVAGALAFIVFWCAAVFHIHAATFSAGDSAAYGAGLAAVLMGMGGAVKLKETTEPDGTAQVKESAR